MFRKVNRKNFLFQRKPEYVKREHIEKKVRIIRMEKSMGENGVPFLFVFIYPAWVKHVFGKESPVPEANQGENNGKP